MKSSLAEPTSDEDVSQREAMIEWLRANALKPDVVADLVHDAVTENKFWIFTDEAHNPAIIARHREIQERRPPSAETIFEEI